MQEERWIGRYIGEAIGDFILILFGVGMVFEAILFNGVADLFSAGMAWALAVALAVYVAGSMSGAHLNPAVTLALAATGRFPWKKVPQYIVAQITGAFLGAAALMTMFSSAFQRFADAQNITIGATGSEKLGAMLFAVSPHPWIVGVGPRAWAQVPIWRGFFTEALGTGLLVLFILVLLERRSVNAPPSWLFPIALGLGIAMIVFVTAPQTMTSLNPARDLGPRIFAWFYGFGKIAFPGIRGGWSLVVTAVAPIVGGLFGGFFYDLVVKRFYPAPIEEKPAEAAVPHAA